MEMIHFSDISVVIQGPVIREQEFTKKACDSVRKSLPGSQLILSTWEGSDVTGLDYDILVLSEDPGNFKFELDRRLKDGTKLYSMNINRQIVSTVNGLKRADRKYACKLRSDTVLLNSGFLEEYQKFRAPIREPYGSYLEHRIVTLPAANPRRKIFDYTYCLCDWFYFGLTKDLLKVWDIPQVDVFYGEKKDGCYQIKDNFNNEQYAWLGFLRKVYPELVGDRRAVEDAEAIVRAEISYANCCIFVTAKKAGIQSLKFKNTGYGASPALSWAGLYTMSEWEQLYKKYCDPQWRADRNLCEQAVYLFFQTARKWRKTFQWKK